LHLPRKDSKDAEEYAIRGPLASIFGGPIARLLDQALIVGNMEQTITILTESTNQSYKTTKAALEKLEKWALLSDKKNRKRLSIQVPSRKPPKRNIGMWG
jgi:hypothetical protein